MAEGFSFVVSVPVEADTTRFDQQVREAVARATQGVSVPVTPGGQGAPVIPRASAAEQAAVDSAMVMAQGRGTGAMGGAPGGGSLSPRFDTSTAQMDMRRIRGIWEEIKRFVETPLRPSIDTSRVAGGMGGIRGGVSPAAVHGLPIVPGEIRTPVAGPMAQLEWDAMIGGMPSGGAPAPWQDLHWTQRGTPGGPRRTMGGGRGYVPGGDFRRGGNILPTNSIRGLAGIFAVTEINNALQASRQGESQSFFARTAEESLLARAVANEQATSGLMGSAISFVPNLLDLRSSPQRIAREATEAVALRQIRDDTRRQQFSTAADVAYREGYGRGGSFQADLERLRIESLGRQDTIKRAMSERNRQITDTVPVNVGGFESLVPGLVKDKVEDEYKRMRAIRSDLNAAQSEDQAALQSELAAEKFAKEQMRRERRLELTSMARRVPGLKSRSEGFTRLGEEKDFAAGLTDALDRVDDDPQKFRVQRQLNILALQGRRIQTRTEQFETRDALDEQFRQSRFRQAGSRYAVDSITDAITTATAREARQFERDSDPENAVRRRNLGIQQLREAKSDYFRTIQFEEIGGDRIAAGSGNPFAGIGRQFDNAEDKIAKSKDGGPGEQDENTRLLGEIDKTLKDMLGKHFKARAG